MKYIVLMLALSGCAQKDDGTRCVRSHEESYMIMQPIYNGTQLMTMMPTWYQRDICDERVIVDQAKYAKSKE